MRGGESFATVEAEADLTISSRKRPEPRAQAMPSITLESAVDDKSSTPGDVVWLTP